MTTHRTQGLLTLVATFLHAATTASAKGIKIDGVRIIDAPEDPSAEQQALMSNVLSASDALVSEVRETVSDANAYGFLVETRPQNAQQALDRAEALALAARVAATKYLEAYEAWARADAISARVRVGAVKRLISEGVAPSNADKQASDAPEYTQHRDHVLELSLAKMQLEADKDAAERAAELAAHAVLAYVPVLVTQAIDTPALARQRMDHEDDIARARGTDVASALASRR